VSAPTQEKRPSLTRQAGALASGSLAAQVTTTVLLIALTRLVSQTELGGYQQLQLIYGILTPLLIAGIPAALLYFIARTRDPAETRVWIGQAYVLLGGIGAAVSIGIALGRVPLAKALGNADLADALLIYAPQPFFGLLGAAMNTALVATGKAAPAAILGALSAVVALVCVVGAALVEPDTAHMAAGLVAATMIYAVMATVVVQRTIGIAIRRDDLTSGFRKLLAYGVPLAITGLAGKLAWQFDRIVVSRQFTTAEFAVYAVGAVELPLTVIIQQSVNAVLVPAVARHYAAGDIAGMVDLWRRAIRRTSLFLLPAFVFFMLTAEQTIRVLFGAGYQTSADVFRIYLLLVPARVATYGILSQAIGRTGINLSASAVFLVVNGILVVALVGPLGLIGPALGTVLATVIMIAYYLVRLRRLIDISFTDLFPWPLLSVNLAISALAGVPVALLVIAGVGGLLQLVVAGLLYAPTYVGLLVVTKRLNADEVRWLHRLVRPVVGPPRRWLRSNTP
jgi:O-antigen/teichoic acid export membrane protein